MGQPNGKEIRFYKRGRVDSNAVPRKVSHGYGGSAASPGPVVRTSAPRENILQQPAQYRDFMSEANLLAGGRGDSGAVHKYEGDKALDTATTTEAAKKYPVVLRYADKDVRSLLSNKQKLFVAVEALDWKPVPMAPSEDSFYAILELAPGAHRYRFILDDKEVVDSTQPLADSSSTGGEGLPVNLLVLNDVLLMTKEDEEVMDDGEGWGQEQIMFEESRKHPPIMPVHLRYTPLNTPPTAVRCTRDGVMSAAGEVMSPENLPLPLNVTINHVYFQRREDHAVMGLTTRCCNKYTTVVYYSRMGAPTASDRTIA